MVFGSQRAPVRQLRVIGGITLILIPAVREQWERQLLARAASLHRSS